MPKKVEFGEYLYLFPAPKATPNCLILAHGGYNKNCLPFPIPPGVTVSFYIPDGGIFSVSVGDFLEDRDVLHVEEKYGHTRDCQSTYCPAYILQKSVNSDETNKHNDAFLNSVREEI